MTGIAWTQTWQSFVSQWRNNRPLALARCPLGLIIGLVAGLATALRFGTMMPIWRSTTNIHFTRSKVSIAIYGGFFVLASASLHIETIARIGWLCGIYLPARIVGKVVGAAIGARVSNADTTVRRWMGVALLPQAGVAIGMALLVSEHVPR